MSLAQTRAILETRMAVAGKSITEHNGKSIFCM
jgi:hypothetical protein